MKNSAIRSLAFLVGALAIGLTSLTSAARADPPIPVQAGPNVFGPWEPVRTHAGSVTYTISASPIGSTTVVGEVRYFPNNGPPTVLPFFGRTTITTCDCIGTVQVRFKGTPFGSVVLVSVSP